MTEEERYQTIELPFYEKEIAPMLPPRVLDFHTHIWSADDWEVRPWDTNGVSAKYMVSVDQYPAEKLLGDGKVCFPDRPYSAVCFGHPVPVMIWENDNAFVIRETRENDSLFPLMIAGKDLAIPRERYERALVAGGYYGMKVYLNWYGNDYGDQRVEDMLGETELALANERRMAIMLHVPRSDRLADPDIQEGVRWLSRECPDARIVLAHCGRCYVPPEMKAAIDSIVNLPNVYMDTSMVMDPVVLYMAMDKIGPERIVFATDFPIAIMRGRRVAVMDHWVDVVGPGYPDSAFRVRGEDIHATFMTWEIALAVRWAGEMLGLSEKQLHGIFWDNGIELLDRVDRRSES